MSRMTSSSGLQTVVALNSCGNMTDRTLEVGLFILSLISFFICFVSLSSKRHSSLNFSMLYLKNCYHYSCNF